MVLFFRVYMALWIYFCYNQNQFSYFSHLNHPNFKLFLHTKYPKKNFKQIQDYSFCN